MGKAKKKQTARERRMALAKRLVVFAERAAFARGEWMWYNGYRVAASQQSTTNEGANHVERGWERRTDELYLRFAKLATRIVREASHVR